MKPEITMHPEAQTRKDPMTTELLHEFPGYRVDAYCEGGWSVWLNWEWTDSRKNGICIGSGAAKTDAIRDALLVLSNAAEFLNRHLEKHAPQVEGPEVEGPEPATPVDRFGGLNE